MNNNIDWFANVESRTHPWPGLNWLTTAINVPDVKKAVDFYQDALAMVSIFNLEKDGNLLFARMRYRGCNFIIYKEHWDNIGISPSESSCNPPTFFYLYVDDLNDTCKKMTLKGAIILSDPKDEFWGDRRARLKDPFGYVWDIAQKIT